ncbi:XrtA system polysaccharide chain length determinant [Roseomonas rosulenta]|uniref:XrtA system polysaccharide chain length determinant n=1 Tax=Roseomonas rosulenta TaxID=2748667 RepID=UPI0018DEFCCB|nr:XrtA system polysaccharide chain length determinant [Roseomonas rosulenta]
MQILPLLQRHTAAAWRQRWKALALTWFVCIAGWVVVAMLPNQYNSTARMYADADAILGTLLRGIAVDSTPAGQVDVLQRTLLSRPNLERVVARTDLDMRITTPQSREQLVTDLGKEIRITPQTRNLFTIEYRDRDPRIARDVVQTLLSLFIEAASGSDRRQLETARTFVAQQLAAYEVQLREAERRRADFRARYGDLLEIEGNSSRLDGARDRVRQLRGELADAQARRDLTRQQIDSLQTPVATGGGGGASPELAQAEQQLRQLRLRYTEEHPDVVATRNIVADLRRGGGARTGGRGPGAPAAQPLREQLTLRLVDAEAQLASVERSLREAQLELDRMTEMARNAPEVQAEFTNLDRDYNVLRRNYEELLARRESVQIGEAARTNSDRVKLEIIDPPTLPSIPVGPNRPLFAAGVLVAGLGAGIALAFLLVQLDGTFYTVSELRKLGLPVLGAVSAPPSPPRVMAGITFACGVALVFVAFGALLLDMPRIVARLVA